MEKTSGVSEGTESPGDLYGQESAPDQSDNAMVGNTHVDIPEAFARSAAL